MRPSIFLLLLSMSGCVETVGEDLTGQLVQVEVTTVTDSCQPPRFAGSAGLHFFGTRDDGSVVFTMSQQAQFGPLADGGTLTGVQRQFVADADGGRSTVGTGDGCGGAFYAWERTDDGLRLTQDWPGADACPTGPDWLPQKHCESTRRFVFTQVGTCALRCVRISSGGEVDCAC